MPRYKLIIEYDGEPFVGWQFQAAGHSVQGVLEAAVAQINGAPATVHGAGRTDAGVHALGQVAHVDLERPWDVFKLRNALNANVRPHPVSVLAISEVGEDFHARFSATRRHYLFRILNRRSPPALDRGKVWWLPVDLDAEAMHAAAQLLVGKHDFSTF
ncbi:MAG: tRNA pseudouridine synthase A, partial [Aestuariivirga sp.]